MSVCAALCALPYYIATCIDRVELRRSLYIVDNRAPTPHALDAAPNARRQLVGIERASLALRREICVIVGAKTAIWHCSGECKKLQTSAFLPRHVFSNLSAQKSQFQCKLELRLLKAGS